MRPGRSDRLKFCVVKLKLRLKEKKNVHMNLGGGTRSTRVTDVPIQTILPFLVQHLTYISFHCYICPQSVLIQAL